MSKHWQHAKKGGYIDNAERTQREIGKKESNECKDKRNELNSKASTHSTKRNELNKQAKELIEIAQRHKHERDEHNKEVRELKQQRDELNERTNIVLTKFDALQKEHNIGGDQSLPSIKAEIEVLEYRQMTQAVTPCLLYTSDAADEEDSVD